MTYEYNIKLEKQKFNSKRVDFKENIRYAAELLNDYNIYVNRYSYNHFITCQTTDYYNSAYLEVFYNEDNNTYKINILNVCRTYILKKEQLKRFIEIFKKYYYKEIFKEFEIIQNNIEKLLFEEWGLKKVSFEKKKIATELFNIYCNENRQVIIDNENYEYLYYKYQIFFDKYFMIFDIHNKKDFETYKENIKKYEEYLKIIA